MDSICGRTYDNGEPCMGEITAYDGIMECESCWAVSMQLVKRKGQLLLTHEAELGDSLQGFTTDNLENN